MTQEATKRESTSVKERALSAGLWAAGLGWLVPNLGAMTLVQQVIPSQKLERWNRLYCKGQLALTGCKVEYRVDPGIDPNKNYIFVQNHTNHFDHVTMYNSTPHFKQGVELETHFSYPFYGWFMKSRGTIPVPPGKGKEKYQTMLERTRKQTDQGASILIFPEGTRTLDGKLASFRPGAFRMAKDLNLEVVPTVVTGMYDFMRKGSYTLRPGQKITVTCSAPVSFDGFDDEGVLAKTKEVQKHMASQIDAYLEQGHD